MSTIISATGQPWKAVVSVGLSLSGFIAMAFGLASLTGAKLAIAFGIAIAGIFIGIAGLILGCIRH